MFFVKIWCLLGLSLWGVSGQTDCINRVYESRLNASEKALILALHNKYRKNICDGKVPGQPRGKGLLKLLYHDGLENSARLVSDRCIFGHHIVAVDPWDSVGQNLFVQLSSEYIPHSDWTKAINEWYNEYSSYNFGIGSKDGRPTGHYTQVVWAETMYIGCDYVSFYNSSEKKKLPYTKLYTCNYGPPGNAYGQKPYIVGNEGCPQLK